MILTDAAGKPIAKPVRTDYMHTVDYIRAVHAYNDKVAAIANEAFDRVMRKNGATWASEEG